MVEWLAKSTSRQVCVAKDDESMSAGHVYFAPEGFHLGVARGDKIVLTKGQQGESLCPSVSKLFGSVANVYGQYGVGILLTGMGNDGAVELKQMLDKGALTIAQDKESCVIFGMPGEAIKLGGAKYILSPEGISAILVKLSNNRSVTKKLLD